MALPRIEGNFAEERRIPMSYQDWLAWAGDSTRTEWVDGEAIVFKTATLVIAETSAFLTFLVGNYAQTRDLGRVFHVGLEMHLASSRSSRLPDVLFIATANLGRLTEDRLEGPADLVVEIVSDDSVTRDRVVKFAEYAAAGVPEYWIFDPRPGKQTSDFFRSNEAGAYDAVPLDAEGRYHSIALPGFWLDPDWLWQTPPPTQLALLARIAPDAFRAALPPI